MALGQNILESPRMLGSTATSYLQMGKQKPWKEGEVGTKPGLEPQADSARAPPGHQAVSETLVTSMDESSDLVPSGDCVSLCPGQSVRKRSRKAHVLRACRRSGQGVREDAPCQRH